MRIFSFLIKFFNTFFSLPIDISIKVNNFYIFANKLDRILTIFFWKFGILEANELNILKQSIKEGMTVVDIGANIGLYTSLLSFLVGDKGNVIAFEPDQNNFRLLKKCIAKNKLLNVTLVNKAIDKSDNKVFLYKSASNSGDHRIYNYSNSDSRILVESTSIDSYFNQTKIDFIKMDIQGSEYNAFIGMNKILQNNKNIKMIIEFCPNLLSQAGSNSEDFYKIIKETFDIYMIGFRKGSLEKITKNNMKKLLNIKNYINILIIKDKNNINI